MTGRGDGYRQPLAKGGGRTTRRQQAAARLDHLLLSALGAWPLRLSRTARSALARAPRSTMRQAAAGRSNLGRRQVAAAPRCRNCFVWPLPNAASLL
eukprot:4063207-Pleurochrysis_carterae.AAC.2